MMSEPGSSVVCLPKMNLLHSRTHEGGFLERVIGYGKLWVTVNWRPYVIIGYDINHTVRVRGVTKRLTSLLPSREAEK